MRPASRGMGMGPPPPTGGMRAPGMGVPARGGFGGAPPGMRPPTNAGNRPGSSAGVPQGMRPPTAGGAAPGGAGGVPIPLQTDVNVVVRPMTGMASGVSGMPTKPLGPGRMIADKSYYLTDLGRREKDISAELERMRREIDKTHQDNALHAALERKYESHMKEVRVLEGKLADFNLAFDKLRTHTPVADIRALYEELLQRNAREKEKVDQVFLKSQRQEKETKEIEERISNLQNAAAERIASLGEDRQQEYADLQDELERINEREGVLQQLKRDIAQYKDTLSTDAYVTLQEGQRLSKENALLQRQRADLERAEQELADLNANFSPQQLEQKLTAKIQEVTAEHKDMEREMKRLSSSIENLNDQTRRRENELSEARKHASKAKKYDAIYERDGKMDEFIAAFPQVKNGEIENKRKMKELVVALLEHCSKEIKQAAQLSGEGGAAAGGPDAARYGDLKDEVSFKDKKLADSEKTLATLQADLAKRREELEKIESLDAKISAEISQLTQRIAGMNEEMQGFKSEEELRAQADKAKKELLTENARQKRAREAIRVQVSLLSAELEKKSKDLSASEPAKRIDAWETKLKTHAGALFTLQDYLHTKKRESDYEGLLKECADITQSINQLLVMQR